jgi:hypothetical protein
MSIISNVNLYLHDKHLRNGTLKSKSTSDLVQKQAVEKASPNSAVFKDGGMIQQSTILTSAPPQPPTIAAQPHTLQLPHIITTSSSNPSSPASSPLLQRSSKFLSGLSGNTIAINTDNFRLEGRKRSMSFSDFSNFYE